MVKLSVVVPFFCAEAFVPRAMENLKRQARPDVEFVVVDDGSSDGTATAIERQLNRVPGARLVQRPTNGGLAAARNSGIEAAEGRYLTFLDADDWYGPGYLAELLSAVERYRVDFVRVDHVQVRHRRRTVVRSPEGRRGEILPAHAGILPLDRPSGVDYPYAWAGIFDLERTGKDLLWFDSGLHTAEDRPWIWRLYLRAESHVVLGLTGVFYRRDVAGSLTQIGDERQLHFIDAFDKVVAEVRSDPEWEARYLPKALRQYCAIVAHHVLTDDRYAPDLRRRLRRDVAAAMLRLPRDELLETLSTMSGKRGALLGRLMRKYGR